MSKATKVRFKVEGEDWMEVDTWKDAIEHTGVSESEVRKEVANIKAIDKPFSVEIDVEGVKFRPETIKRHGNIIYKWRHISDEKAERWRKATSITQVAKDSGHYPSTIHRALKLGAKYAVVRSHTKDLMTEIKVESNG